MVQVLDHLLPPVAPQREDAARRALRRQIARLERQLADALVTAFPGEALDVSVPARSGPRLLSLGELEALRDDLADRLGRARAVLHARGERQAQARRLLEAMHADPRRHRFVRLPRAELGVPGCGSYEVRPRLGLIGMLMGWWQVKLSSGCPPSGRVAPAAALSSDSSWAAEAASVRSPTTPRRPRLSRRRRGPRRRRCAATPGWTSARRPRGARSRWAS